MSIIRQDKWNSWVRKNQDPYGKACVDVAREVMKILDEDEIFDPYKIICDADDRIQAGGITAFMAGMVAQMVSKCHSRGEEFRKAWNGDIGKATNQEDSDDVLNPAILEIHSN